MPGVVLDPFAGVGTSLIAARRLGRRYVGTELSPTYTEMARAKLSVWWKDATIVAEAAPEGQGAFAL